MSDFPNRKAWLEYRGRYKGPFARWAHRNQFDKTTGLEVPFDRSRNAEKREDRRHALAERLARRRRESWKLEKIRAAA